MSEEADYIAQNYGHCAMGAYCTCLKKGWRGRFCPQWRPVAARSWDELREIYCSTAMPTR